MAHGYFSLLLTVGCFLLSSAGRAHFLAILFL